MFTVCLVGPDGVGKTTVARRIEATLPHPVKYIYMGLNTGAANYALPTTRLWSARRRRKWRKAGIRDFDELQRIKRTSKITPIPFYRWPDNIARKVLGLVNNIFEEWYRHFIAWVFEKRGYIVIFDRHFIYDFHGVNGNGQSSLYRAKRQIHDFILKKTISDPELVICLDAPSEIIFSRKNEFTIKEIDIKRRNYLSLAGMLDNFTIIDANKSLESVVSDASNRIIQFQQNMIRNERRYR